jgi:ankyrin repeat protein
MDTNIDIDFQFYFIQFFDLSREAQFGYLCLLAFFIFIIWQVSINPIDRINNGIFKNDVALVKTCLEKGVDANLQDGNGVTLLYLAVTKNYQEIAELLIAHGADVNQGLNEEYGRNPLLAAAIDSHSELMKMLVANGAKTGIHLAALQGDLDAVKVFLEQQTCSINSNRNGGKTPLSLAAIGGHVKIVEFLLDRGAILESFYYSETPLYQAIDSNHLEVVDLLMDRGADPNHACALYIATRQNYLEIVKRLVERGIDINYQDNNFKSTPLHAAARRNLSSMAELLIANGANVNARSNYDSFTPLHDAAEEGSIEVAKILLANGAEIDARVRFGFSFSFVTPLCYASRANHLDMVSFLIRHGANVNIPDYDD